MSALKVSSPSNVTSVYIPIIDNFINEEFVKYSFQIKKIANVDRVDFVFNNAKGRREAFVHFNSWHENNEAEKMKNALNRKNNYKFYFHNDNNSMFWPLLINKNPLPYDSPNRISTNIYTIEDKVNNMTQYLNRLQSITLNHMAILGERNNEATMPNKGRRENEITDHSIVNTGVDNPLIPPQLVRQSNGNLDN